MMIRRLALLVLFTAATARADTLGDLRTALQSLHGQMPLRATYARQSARSGEHAYKSAAAVDVRVDGEGLTITFPKPLVEQLSTQSPEYEAKNDTSAVHAADVSPTNVTQLLNYAPALLRRLDGAKLLQERQGTYGGQPARILVVSVPQRGHVPKMVKVNATETLTMWLGADHLPLAVQSEGKFSAGILFLKAEGTMTESMSLLRRDDRLVVARRQEESQSSGFGMSEHRNETESIALK
jgi:hypothetical protein